MSKETNKSHAQVISNIKSNIINKTRTHICEDDYNQLYLSIAKKLTKGESCTKITGIIKALEKLNRFERQVMAVDQLLCWLKDTEEHRMKNRDITIKLNERK